MLVFHSSQVQNYAVCSVLRPARWPFWCQTESCHLRVVEENREGLLWILMLLWCWSSMFLQVVLDVWTVPMGMALVRGIDLPSPSNRLPIGWAAAQTASYWLASQISSDWETDGAGLGVGCCRETLEIHQFHQGFCSAFQINGVRNTAVFLQQRDRGFLACSIWRLNEKHIQKWHGSIRNKLKILLMIWISLDFSWMLNRRCLLIPIFTGENPPSCLSGDSLVIFCVCIWIVSIFQTSNNNNLLIFLFSVCSATHYDAVMVRYLKWNWSL